MPISPAVVTCGAVDEDRDYSDSMRRKYRMTRPPESYGLKPWHAAVVMTLQLSQIATVIISTAPFDREAIPRESNCWLLRCVGPEQRSELRFLVRS